jgi:hypothetical protein
MESVLLRGVVTFEADTLGGVPGPLGTSGGLAVRRGDRPSARWLVLTLAPPKHTAILSGMLQREPERGCLSRTIALLPNIHFRLCLFNLSVPSARQRAYRLS